MENLINVSTPTYSIPIYHITVNNWLVECDNMNDCVYPLQHHISRLDDKESIHMALLHSMQTAFDKFTTDAKCSNYPRIDSDYDDVFSIKPKLKEYVNTYLRETMGDTPARYKGIVWAIPSYYYVRGIDLRVYRRVWNTKISYDKIVCNIGYEVFYGNEKIYDIFNVATDVIDYEALKNNIQSNMREKMVNIYSTVWKEKKENEIAFMVDNEIQAIVQNILFTIIECEELFYPTREGLNSFFARIVGLQTDTIFLPNTSYSNVCKIVDTFINNGIKTFTLSNSTLPTTYLLGESVDLNEPIYTIKVVGRKVFIETEKEKYYCKRSLFGKPKTVQGICKTCDSIVEYICKKM